MAFPNNPTSPPVLELNSHAINTSCVGFWPLTQVSGTVATDISTGGNDATAGGDPTWTSETIGNVATFDGAGDYFEFTNSQSQTSLTISAWCKFENTWTTNSHMASVADAATADYTSIMWKNAGGTMYLAARQADGTANDAVESSSSNDGNWHHVVGVFNGTSQVLYVDGVQSATNSATPSLTTTTRGRIGMAADSTPIQEFNGDIQNVRIFNTALSADDVALLYSRPWVGTDYDETWPYSPPVPSSMSPNTDALMTDCVGWWPLTDGTGTTAKDVSTGANDGTISGSVAWEAGSIGTNVDFSGSGQNISGTMDISGFTGYTLSAWVRYDAGQSDTRVWSHVHSGSDDIRLYITSSGIPRFSMDDGGTAVNVSGVIDCSDGEWHHIVGTFNGSTTSIYVDGVFRNSASDTFNFATSASDWDMGGGIGQYIGDIQNVRIWSRAITADEVTLLYERPWEGESTYGDVFPNDPPPTLALDSGAAINTNLEGWWPLLETDDYASGAADISGNAYDGTKNGTVTSEPASLGTVANFDGSTGYFQHPNTLAQSFTNSFSVSFWARPESSASDQRAVANWILPGGTGTQWNAWLDVGDGAVGWAAAIYDQSGTYQIAGTTVASATLNEWQHVCATWSSSSTDLLVYVNAVEVASTTVSNMSASTASTSFQIGNSATESKYFDGDMQNVRVWSRALSAAEVQSLYETPWIGSNYTGVTTIYNFILRGKRFRRL